MSFVSQYSQTNMGYSVQEWYQNPKWFEMAIYKPDLESVCGQLQKAIHSLEPIDFEYRVQHKNGGLVWLRNQLSFEVQNNRVFWRSLATDISQAKKQQQLDQERNHILEMIAQGAALTDTLQTIVGLLYRQFGLPVGISSYQAASAQLLAQVGLPAPVITEMKHIQLGENALEMRRLLKQGEIYHLKVADTGIFSPVLCGHLLRAGLEYATLLPMHLESGQVRGGLVFFSPTEFLEAADARIRSGCDLAAIAIERQRLLDSLEHQALHDPLTGLPNRALYKAHLEHAMATALRNQSSFALIQLDLNFFKSLNDTYGHTYGDKVLCRVAQTLLQAVRASDLVARLGGDEFCIVALDIKTHEEAQHFCHKLEQTLASIDLESGESVSAAIGYAIFPSDADQADSLYSHADRAMYHEKKLAR
ncbi:MAG: diguanylate cyclase domain-containing protein [Deinococcales bacterium]